MVEASKRVGIEDRQKFKEEIIELFSTAFSNCDISFVYIDKRNQFVCSYRDLYGKRSLIVQASLGELMISSVVLEKNAGILFEHPPNTLIVYD